VVRVFTDDDVAHVDGRIDPKSDIEVIETELILADLQTLERALPRLEKEARTHKDRRPAYDAAVAAQEMLDGGKTLFAAGAGGPATSSTGVDTSQLRELNLLTTKPFLYVFNADEAVLTDEARVASLRELVTPADAVFLDAKIEAELQELDDESAAELLESIGQTERGLDALARAGFHTLRLQTFLTAGPKESRAWTIHQGDTAPKAAGVIHTDFEKGFIKAEIVSYDDLIEAGSMAAAKGRGQGADGGQGLRDGRRRCGRVPLQCLVPVQRLTFARLHSWCRCGYGRSVGIRPLSWRHRGSWWWMLIAVNIASSRSCRSDDARHHGRLGVSHRVVDRRGAGWGRW